MAAQWPLVRAWLVATIPTLPGLSDVVVYAGPPVTGDNPHRYVTVGFVTDDHGGQYQKLQTDDGTVWQEVGEVRCQIVAQDGGTDVAVTQADAFAIADALEVVVRADRRLGGTLSPEGTSEWATEVHSVTDPNGVATALVHSLRYTTVT
jgi:hypothetical protein